MGAEALISVEEYLRKSYRPDRDFVDGQVLERSGGEKSHSYAQAHVTGWLAQHQVNLQPLIALRIRVAALRVRVPDVVVCEIPLPDEEVFTSPPYLCIEIMSLDDTVSGMQDRMDDYLQFGVPNVWVIDPWKHRGWQVSAQGWATATDGIMRTADGRVAMPLADVLLA